MADFLLELRSEEIPARMQAGARAELEKLFRAQMEAAGLAVGDVTVWSTPRRLALIARELPAATEAVSEEAKGPPVGAPDQAVDGFCRKNGVTRDDLEVRDVKGRETYFAVKDIPGRDTATLLAEAIPAIIRDFSWPKSMRWGEASVSTESLRWVRPLSGIVALFDGEVVPCVMDGLASGRETVGHRFHSSGAIAIDGVDDYAQKLRDASVLVDHEERAGIIREGARKAAKAAGLTVVEDEGLVVENAGLTEWPVPLLGRFDESYLDVPPEVIQLTARVNQKYFVCEKREPDGTTKLANAFICTANIAADDPQVVVDGNRKVLAARLSDARFFWELDQKKTLAEHAKGLERITFHERLGSVADKVDRVAKLARWLVEEEVVTPDLIRGPATSSATEEKRDPGSEAGVTKEQLADWAQQAAALCKADLVTEMVGEFPELQGLMGGYYAKKEGLPPEVADAIKDHYKPVGQGDDVPSAPVTVAVSLADKLDTLAALFFAKERPSGSKDPFALRRASIGLLALIRRNGLRVSWSTLVWQAVDQIEREALDRAVGEKSPPVEKELHRRALSGEPLPTNVLNSDQVAQLTTPDGLVVEVDHLRMRDYIQLQRGWSEVRENAATNLVTFIGDRLEALKREEGIHPSVYLAALSYQQDAVLLDAKITALKSLLETEDGTNLLAGYKRTANILKKEEWETRDLSYSPEAAEKALIDALDTAEPKARQAIEAEDFAAAMSALASLRAPIDRFFEEVTVNDPNEDKRSARLDLLARFRNAVHQVADFSRIEG